MYIPDTWYLTSVLDMLSLDTWSMTLEIWHRYLTCYHLTPDPWHLISDTGTWYVITWHLIPDTWYMTLDNWYAITHLTCFHTVLVHLTWCCNTDWVTITPVLYFLFMIITFTRTWNDYYIITRHLVLLNSCACFLPIKFWLPCRGVISL